MDYMQIIEKHLSSSPRLYKLYITHCRQVTDKALATAKSVPHLEPDLTFIEEAGMLHDIGIFLTDAPMLHCYGKEPYIKHGILGSALMMEEGYPKHALVCERHTGVGITKAEIIKKNLPLPKRDLVPKSNEERIIAYADKFYSKTDLKKMHTIAEITAELSRYGKEKGETFMGWHKEFSDGPSA
jgi:uncharacterized protein